MAYVVGSASVEIVPDFRNAQRKITAFFASQDNSVKVPVDFEVNQQAATKARAATAKVQRDITEDTRKTTVERESMYARMFDQIDRREQASARTRAQAEKQTADEQNRIYAQLLREQAAADKTAASQRTATQKAALREQTQAERDAIREREQLLRDQNRIYDQLLREQARAEQTALRERDRAHAEALRMRQQEARDEARIYDQLLRDQATADKNAIRDRDRAAKEAERTRRQMLIDFNRDFTTNAEAVGKSFGDTILTNAAREIRARSAFLATVVGATLLLGAPAFLAAATTVFAGLGLAATAQSAIVKSTWRGTWQGILEDTRESASDFVAVHTGLANQVSTTYARLKPVLDGAFAAAAPLTEQFGNALIHATATAIPGFTNAIEHSQPVMRGLGDLLEKTMVGLNGFFDALAGQSGSAGNVLTSLGSSMQQLLPAIGQLVATGAVLGSNTLPLLTAGLTLVNQALQVMAPILPAIAAGFAGMKLAALAGVGMSALAGGLAKVAENAAVATYSMTGMAAQGLGGVSKGASAVSTGLSNMAANVGKASVALPALGIVLAGIGNTMTDAKSKEDEWAQAILAGGEASADAYKNYKDNTHWGQSVDEATNMAASWNDAKEKADKLRDSMSPLQLAQNNASRASADLAFAVSKYGIASDEAKAATSANAEAQATLSIEQQKVNAALRDTIPSAEAAKTAMEDYKKALATGDVDGAREALSRYKQESFEATEEQIRLDAALGVTGARFEGYPFAVTSAQEALLSFNGTQGATQEQIDFTIAKIDEWRQAVQAAVDGFVDPLDTYQRLLEAKSANERKAAEEVAKNTVSSSDSWRDYLETTKVTLKEYNDTLQKQMEDQRVWKDNLVYIAATLGSDVAKELFEMGQEGAGLVADMANDIHGEGQRTADLMRQDMNSASDGAIAELSSGAAVMKEVARIAGQDTANALAEQLRAGTITVGEIMNRYGITISDGVNPILTGLGKAPIAVGESGRARRLAEGGVLDYYANGGVRERHVAQIAPAGAMRVWAEPETGGEAYIPLAKSKRGRSLDIWAETGKRLGADVRKFATGGLVAFGRRLQSMGASVAEHPAFPPLSMTGHGKTSLHYTGHAIDVNTRPGTSALEQRELAPMAALARQLGFRTIFMAPDHFNHLHVDDGGGPNMGAAGVAAVVLPQPPSTAPFQTYMSQPADAAMRHLHDQAQAWADVNTYISPEGEGGGGGAGSAAIRALGRQIAASMGLSGQFGAIDSIFSRESGWNPTAQNPTSSAYGIPQFLNATWASYGGKTSDPSRQISAGIRYMIDRYGSPNGANAFWNSHHWYEDGGIFNPHVRDGGGPLMPGYTYNGTGRPEEVVLASSAINGFRAMLGTNLSSPMPRSGGGRWNDSAGGEKGDVNVNGFVNHGQIVVSNMDELAQAAETSKRASLLALGLI